MELLSTLNALLAQPNALVRNHDGIISNGKLIIQQYDNVDTVFGESPKADEIRSIIASLGERGSAVVSIELDLVLTRLLKILLRKAANRSALGKQGIAMLVKGMARLSSERKTAALTEMCNVFLNACYDTTNTQHFIESEGLMLLFSFLRSRDTTLLASVLGVIQGLCYIPIGRQKIRQEIKIVEKVAVLLKSEDPMVRARSIGIFHNLSVDIVSIIPITATGCLSVLASLLRDNSADICTAAVGTLQNLSRDTTTRDALIQMGAVDYVSDLLFASDVTCQVAAVGTLMNLVGHEISLEDRGSFRCILTDALVLGAIRSCVFEDECHTAAVPHLDGTR